MNSQRGLLGLQRGPSPLRVWPAFGGLCPLTLSVMLPFSGHCADGRREGGGGFPQLSPDLGDRGWQAGGGECPAGSWGDWSVFLPPAMAPERRASE